MHLCGAEQIGFRPLDGTRAGSVRQFVEQQSFADRLSGAECDEPNRAAIEAFLDCNSAGDENREELAPRAFLEQHLVALVRDRRDELCQLMKPRVGDAFEELRLAQLISDGGGRNRMEKIIDLVRP
jgi:hypothetical protein